MIHFVKQIPIEQIFSSNTKEVVIGAGCFWGVERKFWDIPGVLMTSVGYSGGESENPTYEDVCYRNTNHAEVVKIVFDQDILKLEDILKVFWECHDPTQGMRQGNDIGTQYRSVIYVSDDNDLDTAKKTKEVYQKELIKNNFKSDEVDSITTEILLIDKYFLAEEYHQQYLAKNPNGYCGIGGTFRGAQVQITSRVLPKREHWRHIFDS